MIRSLKFAAVGLAVIVVVAPRAGAQEAPAPGPEHQRIAQLAGTWDSEMSMGDGSTSKGVATYTAACGGLWLVSDFKSDDGSFSGHGVDGYDPASKKYLSVWVDSYSTKPLMFQGEWDEKSKSLTQTGEGPGMDGKTAKFKSVTHHPDANHMNFEMFVTGSDGQEVKIVTVKYTRRKAA